MEKTRDCTWSSSATEVSINEGLLTLIFLYLPAKSLCICKCVSKLWNSIITSPHFNRLLIPYFNPARGLFVQYDTFSSDYFHEFVCFSLENPIPPPFENLSFVDDPRGLRILHSCNGLLLCCSEPNIHYYDATEPKTNYYIYNPTTQQFTTLLKPAGGKTRIQEILEMKLAFDPWKSPHYKVVCIQMSDLVPCHSHVEIYSSETKKWRVCGPAFPARFDIPYSNIGVYWNGAVYWPCNENSLRFNVEEEKLEKLPMPCIGRSWDDEESKIAYFGESCGHLHLVPLHGRQRLTVYTVYEMKSDGSEWFLKYLVNIGDIAAAFPRTNRFFSHAVLCIVRGEKEEDTFMVFQFDRKVIRYNLSDSSIYKLCDRRIIEIFDEPKWLEFDRERAFQYIESKICM